jgi:hypothetical protein
MPNLVRSICVPVWMKGHVAGAFSLYTGDPRGFNEEDRTLLENIAAAFESGEAADAFDGMLRAKQSRSESTSTVH